MDAYLRDFLERLTFFNPFPNVWCPITPSGDVLLNRLLDLVEAQQPDWIESLSVLPIQIQKENPKIRLVTDSAAADVNGKRVLLLDTAIHSGATMSRCAAEMVKLGAVDVCSYSLMLKCDSSFIPSMWGFMIGKTDRAFFLLDKIPNHRLVAQMDGPLPCVHLERLSEEYIGKPPVVSGLASLDRITWDDRWFDMATTHQQRSSYALLRKQEILGYRTVHHPELGCLMIDEVAVDKKYQRQKLSGILIRFGETLARQSDCRMVRLYAISTKVELYKKFGYHVLSAKSILLGDEEYILMERALLHRLPEPPPLLPNC